MQRKVLLLGDRNTHAEMQVHRPGSKAGLDANNDGSYDGGGNNRWRHDSFRAESNRGIIDSIALASNHTDAKTT